MMVADNGTHQFCFQNRRASGSQRMIHSPGLGRPEAEEGDNEKDDEEG